MKICFAINSLAIGGAERVFLEIANYLAANSKFTIIVFTVNRGELEKYLHPNIQFYTCGWRRSRAFFSILRFCLFLQYNKPDVVVSTLGMIGVSALLSLVFPKTHFISRLANTISEDLKRSKREHFFKYFIQLFVYKIVFMRSSIVYQSQYIQTDCASIGLLAKNSKVIHNPFNKIISDVSYNFDFFTVGRFAWQKNYDLLLRSFAKVRHEISTVTLAIVSEGSPPSHLLSVIDELKLGDSVQFINEKMPFPKFNQEAVFVMSSRFEGMSNAMIEAVGHGYFVVSTDCPGGGREVLFDVNRSLLASDHLSSESLAAVMYEAYLQEKKNTCLDVYPPNSFMQRHDISRISSEYVSFFKEDK
jgi:GalNAc-alpha-(1->4)-GalNAc-alpha-(1->3)-diNAcBac-PP-undecaprenol alpha-1,4-N-acetyl-D-galactosaminyltransferase